MRKLWDFAPIKELIAANGLNEYDFGARHYRQAMPHFTSIDPQCESFYRLSPYLYCANNPVNAIDPDGQKVIIVNGHWSGVLSHIPILNQLMPHGPGEQYWDKGFANEAMKHFGTNKFMYVDGSSQWGVMNPEVTGSIKEKNMSCKILKQ